MTEYLFTEGIPPQQQEEEQDLTPEQLSMDDTMSLQEKINFYATSDLVLHRLYVAKELKTIIGSGFDFDLIISKLCLLCRDVDLIIRTSIACEIDSIVESIIKNGGTVDHVQCVMRLVVELLFEEDDSVRDSAVNAFVDVGKRFEFHLFHNHRLHKVGWFEEIICSIIQEQSVAQTNTDSCMVACLELIVHLAECFNKELTAKYITPILETAYVHESFLVRRTTVDAIASMCECGPIDDQLEYIVELSKDNVWGIRKQVATNLTIFSTTCSSEIRIKYWVPIALLLLNDCSSWVREAMVDNVGGLISSFGVNVEIPVALVDAFLSTLNQKNDHLINCAFFFPGALGKDHWTKLKPAFETLAVDIQWKVRKPIAYGLHELAIILGPQITQQDLLGFFELFCKDIDEVKMGIVLHYVDFVENLPPECIQGTFDLVHSFLVDSKMNWRLRESIAKQFHRILDLYSKDQILRLFVLLCNDPVASVRSIIPSFFPLVFNKLNDSLNLPSLSQVPHYQSRLLFIHLMASLIPTVQSFPEDYISALLSLAKDPTRNVRHTLLIAFAPLCNHPLVRNWWPDALQVFRNDSDGEIRNTVGNLHDLLADMGALRVTGEAMDETE